MPVRIRKMTATFGGLNRAVLTPGDGLTVITAPNEGGKSTWAAFLRVMFYGIDTKERDKVGFLADKNRYQPWSGAPMSGEIELEWEGREITLRRTSTHTAPMGRFQAVYTATGDPVPGLTGANVGQMLLGVSRDVFVRSAFVGQGSAGITSSAELESRVAALATAGEEDVSASATQRTLKDWRNRRRSNRANGLIPALEEELHSVERALREIELARDEREAARIRIKELSSRRAELEWERELHRKLAGKELNRRCGEALYRLQQAEEQLEALPKPDPAFEGLSAAQAQELVRTMEEQAAQARRGREESHARRALLQRRRIWKTLLLAVLALFGIGGLGLVIGGFVSAFYTLSFVGIGSMMAAVALSMVAVSAMGRIDKRLTHLSEMAAADDTEIPDAGSYLHWLGLKEGLEREAAHCRERYEDLLAQGAQPLETLELLPLPVLTAEETETQLDAVKRELAQWQSRYDRATGALRADPLELEARRGELEEKLTRRTAEYEAIELALEVLECSNSALRERFSPTLNRESAEIFSAMTGGRYSALTLSRDFSAMAGGEETHPALCLSAGTVDQLYLSVRLALCRLTVPEAPVLLDDALCAFDDDRMARALSVLRDMGGERQILLFTCQSRESRWAASAGVTCLNM